jgi:hypothetical protein
LEVGNFLCLKMNIMGTEVSGSRRLYGYIGNFLETQSDVDRNNLLRRLLEKDKCYEFVTNFECKE